MMRAIALLIIAGCSLGLYLLVAIETTFKEPYFIWVFSAIAAGIVLIRRRPKPPKTDNDIAQNIYIDQE
ncbi:hypothetical protein COLU111180_19940 [Cohnella lubricantis]|uniref:Uncharacterized protein n=1 Tax=Cohnella lubricantis TaxID=2163172 RepID=A0A841TCC8_9BACL|nr:hypothetical protein [Cohnella lubricantis]MBB6676101.1 hypothetical protein [Cohnella lubricantis]MBP2118059.1 putative membrane protein YfcA [Cohnella lubricantis]